jgi:hypothetical protein
MVVGDAAGTLPQVSRIQMARVGSSWRAGLKNTWRKNALEYDVGRWVEKNVWNQDTMR